MKLVILRRKFKKVRQHPQEEQQQQQQQQSSFKDLLENSRSKNLFGVFSNFFEYTPSKKPSIWKCLAAFKNGIIFTWFVFNVVVVGKFTGGKLILFVSRLIFCQGRLYLAASEFTPTKKLLPIFSRQKARKISGKFTQAKNTSWSCR